MRGAESLAALASGQLLATSIHGGLVILCVWVATRGRAGLPPSWQAWLWWLVCLKLLVLLAGVPGVPLPVLPSNVSRAPRQQDGAAPAVALASPAGGVAKTPAAASRLAGETGTRVSSDGALRHAPTPGRATTRSSLRDSTFVVITGLWLAGLATALGRLALSLRQMRRLVAGSRPVGAAGRERARLVASALGMRSVPDVRTSPDVHAPQVAGLRRPTVLLPEQAESQWTAQELQMALCHELAHVRRRDLLLGWVPVLASRAFFFHPLARLAAREYLVAREAACDALVVQTLHVDPAPYGRLLLRLGAVAPPAAAVAAGASSPASGLKRRLEMLHHPPSVISRSARWLVAAASLLAIVPMNLAATTRPAPDTATTAALLAPVGGADLILPPDDGAATRQTERAAGAQEAARSTEEAETASSPSERAAGETPELPAAVEQGTSVLPAERARDGAQIQPQPRAVTAARPRQEPAEQERREVEQAEARAVAQAVARAVRRQEQMRAMSEAIAQVAKATAARQEAASERDALVRQLEALKLRLESAELALAVERQVRETGTDAAARRARAASTRDFLAGQFEDVETRLRAATEKLAAQDLLQQQAQGVQRARERDVEREPAQALEVQMQELAAQLEAVARQQEALSRQQQALVEAQRQLADQLERLRELGAALKVLRDETRF